jgi:hypothetical protein
MPSRTIHTVARSIDTREEHLVIVTDKGRFEVPWDQCSNRLRDAKPWERSTAVLSPSGYGIHWPLLDEDLAVGPLLEKATLRR